MELQNVKIKSIEDFHSLKDIFGIDFIIENVRYYNKWFDDYSDQIMELCITRKHTTSYVYYMLTHSIIEFNIKHLEDLYNAINLEGCDYYDKLCVLKGYMTYFYHNQLKPSKFFLDMFNDIKFSDKLKCVLHTSITSYIFDNCYIVHMNKYADRNTLDTDNFMFDESTSYPSSKLEESLKKLISATARILYTDYSNTIFEFISRDHFEMWYPKIMEMYNEEVENIGQELDKLDGKQFEGYTINSIENLYLNNKNTTKEPEIYIYLSNSKNSIVISFRIWQLDGLNIKSYIIDSILEQNFTIIETFK